MVLKGTVQPVSLVNCYEFNWGISSWFLKEKYNQFHWLTDTNLIGGFRCGS